MLSQKGFSLIELMVVIAIISILSMLIIPAYQDYVARAKVTSVINKLSEIKTKLSEYGAVEGNYPQNRIFSALGINNNEGDFYQSPQVTSINNNELIFSILFRRINREYNATGLHYHCHLDEDFLTQCECSVNKIELYPIVPAMCRHQHV